MDLYEVVLSEHALKQLDDYVSYIQYTLLNNQAADSVLQDYENLFISEFDG